MNNFEKVKDYILQLGYDITKENPEDELFIVNNELQGVKNLIIDCEDPILVIEQFIYQSEKDNFKAYKRLLQINRCLVHGAFVLDEDGKRILFRDTLQIENLDLNELEGSINSLSLAMSEHAKELIAFAKGDK